VKHQKRPKNMRDYQKLKCIELSRLILVPLKDTYVTVGIWHGLLGFLFLATIFTWVYYAFIAPPVFSKINSAKYFYELERYILKGNNKELVVLADEFRRSIKNIIINCGSTSEVKIENNSDRKITVKSYAYFTLQLIVNRKFCKAIVLSCPGTLLTL
jgi:hypothetical protein